MSDETCCRTRWPVWLARTGSVALLLAMTAAVVEFGFVAFFLKDSKAECPSVTGISAGAGIATLLAFFVAVGFVFQTFRWRIEEPELSFGGRDHKALLDGGRMRGDDDTLESSVHASGFYRADESFTVTRAPTSCGERCWFCVRAFPMCCDRCPRWVRWPAYSVLVLLLLSITALQSVALYYLRMTRLAAGAENDSLTLPGLQGSVRIVHEGNGQGVVRILADSEHDLFFAQGAVHAQRRLWQMEFQRRVGAGRLSEVVGADGVDVDRLMRTFGFYAAAERAQARQLPADAARLQAYTDGVNAYLNTDPPLPAEFVLLRYKPEPWSPADSLVFAQMMALELSGNAQEELSRLRLVACQNVSMARVAQLWPPFDTNQFPTALSPANINLGYTNASALSQTRMNATSDPTTGSLGDLSEADILAGPYFNSRGPQAADQQPESPLVASWIAAARAHSGFAARVAADPSLPQRRLAARQRSRARARARGAAEADTARAEDQSDGLIFGPWLRSVLPSWVSSAARGLSADEATRLLHSDREASAPEAGSASSSSSPSSSPSSTSEEFVSSSSSRLVQSRPWRVFRRGMFGASNNWVVSGAVTSTGKPVLADDPHLELNAPSIWNLLHLSASATNYSAIGSSFAGLPGIVLGRNDRIAWGVTTTGPDVQDLFMMHETPDGSGYLFNGQVVPYNVSVQQIKVRGQSAVTLRVRSTVYGPVVNENRALEYWGDSYDCLYYDTFGVPLALHWPSLFPNVNDRTLSSFLGLNTAANWSDFRNALATYVAPAQNFVYADVDGNIGLQIPGLVPVRKNTHSGMWPAPGTGEYSWGGLVAYDSMPRTFNPPEHFIVTANNRIDPVANYSVFLTFDWNSVNEGYRALRITRRLQELQSAGKVLPSAVRDIQSDVQSLAGEQFVDFATAVPVASLTDAGADLQALLIEWTGDTEPGSSAATAYQAFFQEICKLGAEETGLSTWLRPEFTAAALTNGTDPACTRAGFANCLDFTAAAVNRAAARVGSSPSGWGSSGSLTSGYHTALFEHRILGATPFACFANRHTTRGGDMFTVNVANYDLDDPRMISGHGPAYRHVVDFSAMDSGSVFVTAPGQSGNLFSEHYDDLIHMWTIGRYLNMTTVPSSGASAASFAP